MHFLYNEIYKKKLSSWKKNSTNTPKYCVCCNLKKIVFRRKLVEIPLHQIAICGRFQSYMILWNHIKISDNIIISDNMCVYRILCMSLWVYLLYVHTYVFIHNKYIIYVYTYIYIYIYILYIYIYYYLKQHYTTFEKIFWSRSNFHFEDPIFRGAIHRTKKMKVAPWELNPSWLFFNFLFRLDDIYIIYIIYI